MKTQEHENIKTKKPKRLPKSVRKYIRIQKAQIRKEIVNSEKQTQLINQLYQKFGQNH